jgi:hypothetical protein
MPGVGVEQEKQTAQGAMEISVSRQELLRELTATQRRTLAAVQQPPTSGAPNTLASAGAVIETREACC